MSPNHSNVDDGTDLISAPPTHYGQEVPSLTANERKIQENNTADDVEGITTMDMGKEE